MNIGVTKKQKKVFVLGLKTLKKNYPDNIKIGKIYSSSLKKNTSVLKVSLPEKALSPLCH